MVKRAGSLVAGLCVLAAGCSGGDAGRSVIPGPERVTLADVQANVFSPRCASFGCHAGELSPFGLDLSAGESLGNLVGVASSEVPGLLRVEPFDAANSYLYMKVTADPRILGDPMPATGPPLSAGEIALVESWIDQGAL